MVASSRGAKKGYTTPHAPPIFEGQPRRRALTSALAAIFPTTPPLGDSSTGPASAADPTCVKRTRICEAKVRPTRSPHLRFVRGSFCFRDTRSWPCLSRKDHKMAHEKFRKPMKSRQSEPREREEDGFNPFGNGPDPIRPRDEASDKARGLTL